MDAKFNWFGFFVTLGGSLISYTLVGIVYFNNQSVPSTLGIGIILVAAAYAGRKR